MSLYRKYRPRDFRTLIGQEHIKQTLLNAIKNDKLVHAYLFTGPRGTGKTTTARLLAKAINIDEVSDEGVFGDSELAEEIDSGRLIDLIEIDAASNRGIDEIRDLREKINYAPTRAKSKVYIIDEVHMLTKEAFNALLKTLEEPPDFVYFILATTEINKVPETIISRCQRFDFRRIPENILEKHLGEIAEMEGILAEEEAIKIVAKHARGGARDALTLFEQLVSDRKLSTERVREILGISNELACGEMFQLIWSCQTFMAIEKLDDIFRSGADLSQFNKDFLDYLRRQMLEAVKSNDNDKTKLLISIIGFFQDSLENQKHSYIPELPLEVAIAKSSLILQQGSNVRISHKIDDGEGAPKIQNSHKDVPQEPQAQNDVLPEQEVEVILTSETAEGLTVNEINQRWEKFIGRISIPLVKRCLMVSKADSLQNGTVTLVFSNNFNRDKLFVTDNLVQAEKAFAEEFGLSVKFESIIRETEKNIKKEKTVSAETDNNDLLTNALNVFGGEVTG